MFMPPTALKLMRTLPVAQVKQRWPNIAVRTIASGGEALGQDLLAWGHDVFGLTINEFYGQTECNLVLGNSSVCFPPREGSMGRAMPGHKVVILSHEEDNNNNDNTQRRVITAPGEVGDIAVLSDAAHPHPVQMLSYWENPDATAKKFVSAVDSTNEAGEEEAGLLRQNRFLVTGDLGYMDQDGYFFFHGRDDDVISSAGYRIGPSEIENCLLNHEAVSNAAVVGVPDQTRGELVKAFIVPAPAFAEIALGADQEGEEYAVLVASIQNHIKDKLARYEYPRLMEFVQELPMTTTGKIIRRELRQRHHQQQP